MYLILMRRGAREEQGDVRTGEEDDRGLNTEVNGRRQ
jgi:hypothetical protein